VDSKLWERYQHEGRTYGSMGVTYSGKSLHINELLLLGDSKIIIDWLSGRADFHVADLVSWKERTREATQLIYNLTFSHIYREENNEADTLSKKALFLPSGHICFTRWEEGNEGPSTLINL
jgi:hypothetical protein